MTSCDGEGSAGGCLRLRDFSCARRSLRAADWASREAIDDMMVTRNREGPNYLAFFSVLDKEVVREAFCLFFFFRRCWV